jgi:hypothetical protein
MVLAITGCSAEDLICLELDLFKRERHNYQMDDKLAQSTLRKATSSLPQFVLRKLKIRTGSQQDRAEEVGVKNLIYVQRHHRPQKRHTRSTTGESPAHTGPAI